MLKKTETKCSAYLQQQEQSCVVHDSKKETWK